MEEENKQEQQEEETQEKVNIKKYRETSGLSLSKLKLGFFLLSQRNKFKIALISFLTIFIAITWSYSIYHLAYYFAKGRDHDEMIMFEMVNEGVVGHEYISQLSPKNLMYSTIKILHSSDGKYDLMLQVTNPSKNYYTKFNYCFVNFQEEIECDKTFVLPGETKMILSLGKDIKLSNASVKFVTENLKWQRINKHKIKDWDKFANEHLNFEITDTKYSAGEKSLTSNKLNINSLTFRAKNNSPYGYRNATFNIVLYNFGKIASVSKYIVPRFLPGDDENLAISWVGPNMNIDKIDIQPNIDIMDDNSYITFKAGQ